jgi:hypothetical protein
MDDFEVMRRSRLRWVKEIGRNTDLPMPSLEALAAYHRGFMDALEVALVRVINDEREMQRRRCPDA